MSILDQIYGSAKSVQTELKGMNAAIKGMAAADKKEYALDSKDRRYEREKDKREAQDRKDFNKKVYTTLDEQSKDLGKQEEGKKLAAGMASATAAAIAETVKKNNDKKKIEEPKGTGGPAGISMSRAEMSQTPSRTEVITPVPRDDHEERLAELEATVFNFQPSPKIQKLQSGGFAGAVPNLGQPTTGDHFYTHVQPGSYVLNRNAVAAMGFQGGGNVPVALEQGEIVIPPGQYDQKMMDFINYSAAPRFQEGGVTGKQEGKSDGEKVEGDDTVKGKFGLVNPTPKTRIADNKLGYAADTGLDIQGATGDPIVAPVSGMLEYLEKGHTSWKDDSDPGTAGYQPQHSFRIKLDSPFEYEGTKVNFAYGTHMSAISKELGNKKDVHVSAGTFLGNLGVANSVPHLHLGLVTDRPQTSFLNYKQVSAVLQGAPTSNAGGGDTENNTGSSGDDSQPSSAPEEQQSPFGSFGPLAPILEAIDKQVFQSGENAKYGISLGMLLNPEQAFSNLMSIDSVLGGGGGDDKSGNNGGDGGDTPLQTGEAPKSNKPYDIASSIGFSKKDWDIYRNVVGMIESGNKYNIAGGSGDHYDGRWQMGADAKTDAARYLGVDDPGHGSAAREKFRQNSEMQERFFAAFTAKNHQYLSNHPKYRNASTKRKFEILGYAHNQGAGNAQSWLSTGVVGRDGFGTKGTKYSDALRSAYKGKMKGGMVGLLSKVIGVDLNQFFEQSDIQLQRQAAFDDEPSVINMADEDPNEPLTIAHSSGYNGPTYNLPTRDYCPLSVYYRYHPSLNPQGMNP